MTSRAELCKVAYSGTNTAPVGKYFLNSLLAVNGKGSFVLRGSRDFSGIRTKQVLEQFG
jgi:hypothetical protein